MGPLALVALLFLMHFGAVAKEPAWLWVAVFIAIPASSRGGRPHLRAGAQPREPPPRVAVQAAAATMVIYLTGWGPVLTGAYAFLALENVSTPARAPGGSPHCGA